MTMLSQTLSTAIESALVALGGGCFPQQPTVANVPMLQPKYSATATPLPAPSLAKGFATSGRSVESLKEHLDYLREVSRGDAPLISRKVAELAVSAWQECSVATGFALPIPAACTGPDGQLLYTWDRGEHHFELEIGAEGEGTFFYRNRTNGDLWLEDYHPDHGISDEAIRRLKLFI